MVILPVGEAVAGFKLEYELFRPKYLLLKTKMNDYFQKDFEPIFLYICKSSHRADLRGSSLSNLQIWNRYYHSRPK